MKLLYLLELEWLKMRHYLPFRVLTGLYVVLLPLSLMAFKSMPFPKEFSLNSYFMFPDVWQTVAYAGNWVAYFSLGFISILNIMNEYSLKTLRQNIINGISRKKLLLIIKLLSVTRNVHRKQSDEDRHITPRPMQTLL